MPIAAVGQTVEYTYCGTNTSTIPLTVVRLVDDRIGVVLEGGRVVAPGESLCNTDVGAPASYVVQESDVGSVIINNAVVTVETQEEEPREFQAIAQTEVLVPVLRGLLVQFCHAEGNGSYQWHANSKQGLLEGHLGHPNDIVPPLPPSSPMDTTGGADRARTSSRTRGARGPRQSRPTPDANANANCDGLTVDATGYPAGSTVEVVIDGSTSLDPVDGQGNLHKTYPWTQTVNHTWSVTVLNPNADRWAVNNGTWTACQPPDQQYLDVDDDDRSRSSAVGVDQGSGAEQFHCPWYVVYTVTAVTWQRAVQRGHRH